MKDQSLQINRSAGEGDRSDDARLEDIFKTRATKVVFVKGDPDVDYRYVAQAIDDAKGAGLDKGRHHDSEGRSRSMKMQKSKWLTLGSCV